MKKCKGCGKAAVWKGGYCKKCANKADVREENKTEFDIRALLDNLDVELDEACKGMMKS